MMRTRRTIEWHVFDREEDSSEMPDEELLGEEFMPHVELKSLKKKLGLREDSPVDPEEFEEMWPTEEGEDE